MGLLPIDENGKLCVPETAAASRGAGDPLGIISGIYELGERQADDAWAVWHRDREARFGEFLRAQLLGEMDRARAPKKAATVRKYAQHWARFEKFAAECAFEDHKGFCALPGSWPVVVDFLLGDLQAGKSYGAIRQAAAAISDAHVRRQLADPCSSPEVREMLCLCRQHAGQFADGLDGKPNGKANGKANGKGLEHEHEEISE